MSEITGFRDRGATKYFCGREEILSEFHGALAESIESQGGSILLIQGPPGVGKTALLAKCWEEAKKKKWDVKNLSLPALWNADRMRKCLGLRPKKRTTRKGVEAGGKLGGAGVAVEGKITKSSTVDTSVAPPLELLQRGKKPLLLILDEAQHLGEDSKITGEYKDDVRDLLNQIHNGRLGRPVILLAGGLGMTFKALEALGISRMAEECKFDMKPLEKEEEREVIQDWLEKEGKAEGDITDWVEAISQETHCWPQHIHSYSTCAARVLKQSGGKMTAEGLRIVMEKGRAKRRQYYVDRLSSFTAKECRSLARILTTSSEEGIVEQEDVVEQLDREFGVGNGEEIFFRAVRKGVFYLNNVLRCYSVPIPSMRNFIVKNFPPKEISEQ